MPRKPNNLPERCTLSVRVDKELADRVRKLVKFEAGSPYFLTMSGFVSEALEKELARYAKQSEAAESNPPHLSNSRP